MRFVFDWQAEHATSCLDASQLKNWRLFVGKKRQKHYRQCDVDRAAGCEQRSDENCLKTP